MNGSILISSAILQIVSLTISAIFGAVLTYAVAANRNARSTKAALFSLVKSQLVSEWRRLMRQGFVYLHELEAINQLNEQYERMGGNGSVRLLVNDVRNLPRKVLDLIDGPINKHK